MSASRTTFRQPADRSTWLETLTLAARSLADLGTFTVYDLAVAAWKLDPDGFGVPGYGRLYPDTHRVVAEVSKGYPPLKGLLRRVRPGVYELWNGGEEG